MNQAQRKYFIARVSEIAKAKLDEIRRARSEKENALKSVHARALDYLTACPVEVSAQLLELTRKGMGNTRYFEISFTDSPGSHDVVPDFYTACVNTYKNDLHKIVTRETAQRAKVLKKKQELIDKAYFEELPKEFLKLLEKFEALKV